MFGFDYYNQATNLLLCRSWKWLNPISCNTLLLILQFYYSSSSLNACSRLVIYYLILGIDSLVDKHSFDSRTEKRN